jgi:hypothetical protein
VPGGAFHSDVLLIKALSYHRHHELVKQFRLLHYGSEVSADGPERFLQVKTDVLNTHTTAKHTLLLTFHNVVML